MYVCTILGFFCITGSWVPLDEYYYGKKEGDPAYREEKGEYRFKVRHVYSLMNLTKIW